MKFHWEILLDVALQKKQTSFSHNLQVFLKTDLLLTSMIPSIRLLKTSSLLLAMVIPY